MESINNLVIGKNSLKIRLIIALLSINLLILLYGGISIYLVNELYAQAKITTSQTLPLVQQTNEFNQELSRFRRNLSKATLAADQNEQNSIKLKLTEGRQKILQIGRNLEQFANTEGERASLKEMEKAVNSYFEDTEDMIRISNSSFDPTLKMKLTSNSLSKFEELMMRLQTIEDEFGKNSLKASENLTVLFASNQSVTGVTLFLITVFLVLLSIRTLTTILRPINRSIELVTDYSKGNFTAEIPEEKTLEYGKIFTAFGNMAARLSDVIRNIRKVSAGILKSSGSLVGRSDTLSRLSQDMAASSEESSASIEELSTSLENVGKSITSQTKNMYEIESNINGFTESIDEIKKSSERLAMI
ncbi:MAG TPA: methyl-accepting chemotaxis protein, partial [Leptospiraceae bacterium]|nr:methyl-accepting chemotaxis protein [Leptospiraceae bacterium]